MPVDVRRILLSELSVIPESRVALLLSGGVDSLVCGLALAELGKDVTAYSFMLDGVLSTDFSEAQRRARRFGWRFKGVFLPRDLASLKADLLRLAANGAKKKTDFECGWPVMRAIDEIEEVPIVTGHGADGHFCISKKGMIHFRDRIDAFRTSLFTNPNYAQRPILQRIADQRGKTLHLPFLSREMHLAFLGTTWDEVNKPRQKQPMFETYPDVLNHLRIKPHTNLQLGDSGIAEHFDVLVQSDWNIRNAKTPISLYNRLASGEICR